MALDPLTAGLELAKSAIDKIWPDAGEAERQKIATIVTLAQMQTSVNQAEATHRTIFVAGWRPFIGWVCGSALTFHYIVRPMLPWIFSLTGHDVPAIPPLDMGDLITILLGMLGLGGLRTFEKVQRVAK